MDIKNQEWLEIFLWYRCNIKCNFCYQKDLRKEFIRNIEKEEVLKLLENWIKDWKRFIIFSWWEPTLDLNLSYYISFARGLWYEHIRVHTNWWWFSKYEYLEDLYKKWLTWVTISVHWYWKVQDLISWVKWNFDFLLKALINFEKLKRKDKRFVFDTNTVICKQNYRFLFHLFRFLQKFSITRRMLVFPYHIDRNSNELKNILPNNFEFLSEIEKVLEFMHKIRTKDFVLETLPYCMINEKYWWFIEKNFKTDKEVYYIDGKKDKKLQYNIWKIKYLECKKCSKNDICFWFSQDFLQILWKPNFTFIK